MTAMRWLIVFLAVFISGCAGAGLSKSESLSHYNPLTLMATKSKGDILIQEGLEYSREGFFEKFMASMREALIFYSADGEKTSDIYGYLGNAYLEKNEYDKALDCFNQSLSAAKINGYNHGIVLATVGIANCYKKIGDTDKAIEILAASPKKNPNTGSDYPLVALSMGENLAQKGDLSQALEIFNKLLSGINSDKDDKLKQSVYSSLGTTLFGLSRYEEAIANYQHALDLARKSFNTADVVDILNNIGFCLVSLKKYDDATRVFKEGLGLLAVMDLYYPEKQMYANYGLGLLNEEQNRNTQALLYYNTAIRFIEDLRGKLSSTEFRSFFLANKIAAYEHAIDILLTVGGQTLDDGRLNETFHKAGLLSPAELAFFYAESTKARSFIELLSKTKTGTLADRIPKELAEQEKKLLNTIASIQAAGGGQSKSQKELMKKSKRELDELIVKLRKDYPDYASIRYPEPVTAGNIPLRGNEVLLAYKVNPGKTYLWIIEKDKKTSAIEIAVSREELIRRVMEFRGFLENPGSLEAYAPEKGQALGRLLLGEALSRIDTSKNIIITPDGVLNILPFEALTVGKTSNTVQYMGEKFKISYYPSASVMATMRRFKESPKLSNPLFALGDPVYDDSDSRYSLKKSENIAMAAADKTPGLNLRSALVRSGFSLPRLPETRDEVLRIGELFGYKTNDPNIKLDMDAIKSELLKSNLGNYRFIHFATHGILSGDIPYILEPAIVLTQPGNRNPEDGFLKMSEILELKLNADTVVLSACKTALGKEIAGEGVVGLSRAFMLAGSKSVIVSLWSVESNSTAVLMKSFYSHLMKPGRSKEEALRLAKQELKNQSLISDDLSRGVKITGRDKKTQTGTAHPFFWAPFILIGEWE